MPKTCIKAYHEMEERYARLELLYFNIDQRALICNTVTDMIKKYGIAPDVTTTAKDKESGEYVIEFHDDYDRASCNFFEDLIKNLNIGHCEVG